jgi:hypothetical protein
MAIRAKLEALPLLGKLITGYKDRVMVDPSFLKILLREEAIVGTIGLTTEYLSRGDRFKEELGEVTFNLASGIAMTASLVWFLAPVKAVANQTMARTRILEPTIFAPGIPNRQRMSQLADTSKTYFLVGAGASAVTTTLFEGIDYLGDPNSKTLSERIQNIGNRALMSGVLMGVSTNLRYHFMNYLDNNISRVLKNDVTAKIVITGLRTLNGGFGSWQYIKLSKLVGINSKKAPIEDESYPLLPDLQSLAVSDLGDGYFRMDESDSAEEYLFDFLRQGEKAGPSPLSY